MPRSIAEQRASCTFIAGVAVSDPQRSLQRSWRESNSCRSTRRWRWRGREGRPSARCHGRWRDSRPGRRTSPDLAGAMPSWRAGIVLASRARFPIGDALPLAFPAECSYSQGARGICVKASSGRRGEVVPMTKALRGVLVLLSSAAILAVSAATAFAGDGYASGGVAGDSTGGGGGTLPFTGAELALYVVIGLAIVASGLALRAYSARRVS